MPKAAYEDWGPGCSELSSLKSATDKALLDNTEERYKAGNIYTRSGRLLLAVNPYKKLPLYTDETLQAYKSSLAPQARGAPHRESLWREALTLCAGVVTGGAAAPRLRGRCFGALGHAAKLDEPGAQA